MTMKDTRKYKQTELGLLPEDWEVAKLGEKFRFISNNTFSRDFLCEDGEIKNIHYGDVLIKYGSTLDVSQSDIPTINSELLPSYQLKCFAEDGDIIIADTAEDETVCKATELWNIGGKRVVAGLHTMWCRPAQNTFAIKFLGYFMNTSLYHNQVLPLIQGIKVSSVSKSAIQGTWLCIPPIEEQRRIASALTSIDNLIDSLDRQIAKKRDIKQGAMQQLLSGKKRLKGFTEPWVEKKLGDVVTNSTGLTYSPNNVKKYGTLVLRSSNIKNGKLIFEDNVFVEMSIPERAKVHTNDLLVCVRNGSKALIGKSAVITEDAEGMAFGAFMTILRANGIEQIFLNYYWQTDFVQKQVRDNMGATINQITNADISDFDIYVPYSFTEQQSIASVLTFMDNELSALEAKRKKYEQIKQVMMQTLLTGRIRMNYNKIKYFWI